MSQEQTEFSELYDLYRKGDAEAGNRLALLVFADLKRIARRLLSKERADHTLQPTALVHEAWLRLFGPKPLVWRDREHFFNTAAGLMRRLLVDHARHTEAQKRGGQCFKQSLHEVTEFGRKPETKWLELDEALTQLKADYPRCAYIVELRFFLGLKEKEIAQVLEMSERTVKRDWIFARTWLYQRLGRVTSRPASATPPNHPALPAD